ncbi:hypothetical protein ACWF2L_30750 [Streptomyces anulatus]
MAVVLPGDRGSQLLSVLPGQLGALGWRSLFGATEGSNDWQDAFERQAERVWRAPFKVIEDRNGWVVAAPGGTATWRSPSKATGDRSGLIQLVERPRR